MVILPNLDHVANELIKRAYTFNKTISLHSIFSHLKYKVDRNSFYDFMKHYINNPPEKLEVNTIEKIKTTHTHCNKHRSQLQFTDIHNKMISDFQRFMQNELHPEGAACNKYMEHSKK